MDFVICSSNQLVLALTPQAAQIDTGLFVRYIIYDLFSQIYSFYGYFGQIYHNFNSHFRPFTRNSWQYVFIMLGILIIGLAVPYVVFDFYEKSESFMVFR